MNNTAGFGGIIVGLLVLIGIIFLISLLILYVVPTVLILWGTWRLGRRLSERITQRYILGLKSGLALLAVAAFSLILATALIGNSSHSFLTLPLAALIFTGSGILLLDGWARLKYQGAEVQLEQTRRAEAEVMAQLQTCETQSAHIKHEVDVLNRDFGDLHDKYGELEEVIFELCIADPRPRDVLRNREETENAALTDAQLERKEAQLLEQLKTETDDQKELLILRASLVRYERLRRLLRQPRQKHESLETEAEQLQANREALENKLLEIRAHRSHLESVARTQQGQRLALD